MPYARSTDGIQIHYEALGRKSAPAVLMIQGLGADKHGWDMQRYVLALKYRVIAFDNRGAGRSDKPFSEYSLEQMADRCDHACSTRSASSGRTSSAPRWVARSACWSACNYPERVDSLTLACTAGRNHAWRRELVEGWAAASRGQGHGHR